jgi:hypothetical protein
MKYLIGILFFTANSLFACEKCLNDMEIRIEITQYFLEYTESEYYQVYQRGVIQGLMISCDIYNLNHDIKSLVLYEQN